MHQQNLVQETNRWRQILRCLLDVTLFLAERNLPFRGSSAAVGDPHNGLFLGTLELLSSYDLTIKHHLDQVMEHQKKGERLQAHYLSWQTQNEFLALCAKNVLNEILKEIRHSYYYGLIVDGTPDVSHTEHLTFVLRYVGLKNRQWHIFERFLTLKNFEKKKGEDITKAICDILENNQIDLGRCRGQGYDNGSNMSGCYKGVQAEILRKNPQALYTPCSAHSLNLCGVHAVESAPDIKSFFGNIQKFYNVFAASPSRWKILKETVGVSLHSLSQTRWSARVDAIRPLVKNHMKMLESLLGLQTDLDLPAETFSDVENLIQWMKSFEYIVLSSFWFKTLQCIDDVNKLLQYADISIAEEVRHLDNLRKDIQNIRNSWDCIHEEAKLVASALEQTTEFKDKRPGRRRNMFPDEPTDTEHIHDSRANAFKTNVFYTALDMLLLQLTDRFEAVKEIAVLFEFIVNPPDNPSSEDIAKHAKRLAQRYPNDLTEEQLEGELRHYAKFRQSMITTENKALALLNGIYSRRAENLYPQICICLRIFLSIPGSVASGERSFSKLALIKNCRRSAMKQERLTHLMILSIEHELAKSINLERIIDDFAAEKARKKAFN